MRRVGLFVVIVGLLITTAYTASSDFDRAVALDVPPLRPCPPANIRVHAQGNYTLQISDPASNKVLVLAKVEDGVSKVTWDSVNLAPGATALITLTAQTGPSWTQTITTAETATVRSSSRSDSTCMEGSDLSRNASSKGSESKLPLILSATLGTIGAVAAVLIVFIAMRRRKRSKAHEAMQDDTSDSIPLHNTDRTYRAGEGYMAKLVPGLRLQGTRPHQDPPL